MQRRVELESAQADLEALRGELAEQAASAESRYNELHAEVGLARES